ncbi:hypothetical protein RHSIM_Rhsim09G0018800 [Rhododendron simsii]|uniref:Uncharacterized protein n=1 Tax=Rhododendron simsii TaxID=118357 RepID=A0A834GHQ8_RHOSS|nr:hypothetical protein RHSIM_Rhsim09G0018800 [Rhododendron simsii]
MDKTSEGCCKEILCSYMSRHYCGDLDGAYEVIEKNCAGSISVKVANSALWKMLPFPYTKRYTVVILKPEERSGLKLLKFPGLLSFISNLLRKVTEGVDPQVNLRGIVWVMDPHSPPNIHCGGNHSDRWGLYVGDEDWLL